MVLGIFTFFGTCSICRFAKDPANQKSCANGSV
jgi:hypothetical protein